jgi:cystathionine beta-lyase
MNLDDIDIDSLRRRRGEKWSTYPPDVLPAWVADMDFPVCEPVRHMLEERVALSDLGYPIDAARRGVAESFAERARRRFDWHVSPQRIEVLSDVVQGLYLGLMALSEPGAGAIVQTPVYPPFLHAVPECGRRLIVNELRPSQGRYAIDFDELRASIDRDTRLLLFCNPQNPTGRAFTRDELETLAEIVLRHDLVVCSDEIHADLAYPGCRHIPFAAISPEIAARTVTLTSATKAFNIAGLRCAVAVFGSDELQARFNAYPVHSRGGLGSLGLAATALAWSEGQPWLDEVMAYLEGNRAMVRDFVADHLPAVRCASSDATYLAWLDCRALGLESDPCSFFLNEGKVALSDGAAFGPGGVGFVRLNFATARPILASVLDRMRTALAP